jgi:hypothetical protein
MRSGSVRSGPPRLALFGAFRSGTNVVKALVELNYHAEVNAVAGGWKHVPVGGRWRNGRYDVGGVGVLGVVKHPLAWLESFWRYAQGPGTRHVSVGATWSAYLDEPVTITFGDIIDFPSYWFASPADYWNAMAHNLLSLEHSLGYVVRFEDLLPDPEAECMRIAAKFDLHRTTDSFTTVDKRVRRMAERRRTSAEDYVTAEDYDPSDYIAATYVDAFTDVQLEQITSDLDPRLMASLGYHCRRDHPADATRPGPSSSL